MARVNEPSQEAIREVLAKFLPSQGLVLEIGSGTGQHVLHFARHLKTLTWQPTASDPDTLGALTARVAEASLPNVLPPLDLDVQRQPWPGSQVAAVIAIDIVNTMPWDSVLAMFFGASRAMLTAGVLFIYSAVRFNGRYTAKINQDRDQTLRARDDRFGLRDIRELTVAGTRTGFGLERTLAMPDDYHSLVFKRRQILPPSGAFNIG
jgi:cyclopropane fatty-acyl-phospholipid synthase-like methyltransferase